MSLIVIAHFFARECADLLLERGSLLSNESAQTLDLFFGCFGTAIVVRRNIGALSLSSCKTALGLAARFSASSR